MEWDYKINKPVSQNIPSYLEKLEKGERIKDWQVKQAADAVRAKRRFKLPVVLSRKEVTRICLWIREAKKLKDILFNQAP